MSEGESGVNLRIEQHFERALEGDTAALTEFFLGFLAGPLYVPERYQAHRLSDSPEYPNDFVRVLGLRIGESATVPAFTRAAMIEEWCGNPLTYLTMTGADLANAVPEGWAVCINPGSEIEKDLSAWEIDQLRGGQANIPAIISELNSELVTEPLQVRALEKGEYPELQDALLTVAQNNPEVEAVTLLVEEGRDENDKAVNTVLVGAEIAAADRARFDEVSDALRTAADRAQIGDDRAKVMSGAGGNEALMLQPFKPYEPFYRKKQPSRLAKFFKKSN